MKIVNLKGRLALLVDHHAVDVASATDGRFGPDVQSIYAEWDAFSQWARSFRGSGGVAFDARDLGAPAPRPPQVFAIGLNYRDHAAEAKLPLPEQPMVFTKFPASVTGPTSDIVLPGGSVDFETELVVVIGRRAERIEAADAWSCVAGLTAGQDLSERGLQMMGSPPQFSLAKSFPGFSPLGPALVTPDEFANPDDIALGCTVNGVEMQASRSSQMVFSIPRILAYLSAVVPLQPGDIVFTGTPAGVGIARTPRRFFAPGDELVTIVEGIGEMRHRFVRKE